ncbi:MAG: tetratricopeptide repeat protein [Prevotella sp.]|nr:tetratricopeptide repeat protein [Prevotella sp.]
MTQNEQLLKVIDFIENRRLGYAITQLENFLLSNPQLKTDLEKLISIQNDYKLMSDYWQRGYDDPEREMVYSQLLRRLYVLATNIIIHDRIFHVSFLKSMHTRPRQARKNWSIISIRRQLEEFVSDVAMLEFEPEEKLREKSIQIYVRHQLLTHDLFDYILTSRLWNDELADAFVDILLSPTIDTIDQQLIVSAITLSAINHFGINKFRILTEVSLKSTDEEVRQRALVGWVFCLDERKTAIYPEMEEMVRNFCENQDCLDQLAGLQIQLIYCMETEQDQRTIKDEIIPDILQGNSVKLTSRGLIEMEEDKLEEILHPEKTERDMERMEESINRIVEMQKRGTDVYFGGFSQMKRFSFYNQLSNWFVPFYPQHPSISQIWNNTTGKTFLHTITNLGAFCDSDKYSFILAFDQVLKKLPPKMLEMIENGEASAMPLGGEIPIEEQRQKAFIRRRYLQNVYRFFRLFSMRSEFRNPFEESSQYVFFANQLFRHTQLADRMLEIASFLMKHKRFNEAKMVIDNYETESYSSDYYLMKGSLLMRLPMRVSDSAVECFQQALEQKPDSEQAISGLARANFRNQNYAEALKAYRRLIDMKPDHRSYLLNAAICLTNMNENQEALKLLYKLEYLYPDDVNAKSVLAWVQTIEGKYEQAEKNYLQLLSQEQPQLVDMLNIGYCKWLEGKIVDAINHFKQIILRQQDGERFDFENEFMNVQYNLLKAHHISDTEIQMMIETLL